MNAGENGTVFGRSLKMRGDLFGSEDFMIEGEFEGVIRNAGSKVTIGPTGRVRAAIAAQDVVIFGQVEGEIRATGSVSLKNHSVVIGDILAARLAIEEDATLRGRIDPSRCTEPLPANWSVGMPTLQAAPAPEPVAPLVLTAPEPPVEQAILFGGGAQSAMPAGLAAAVRKLDAVTGPEGSGGGEG